MDFKQAPPPQVVGLRGLQNSNENEFQTQDQIMPSSSSAINANNEVNGNFSNDDQSKLDHENTFQDTSNQLQIEESQVKDVLDFQCHLNDFKENEMTEKVLIRLMKDWTQNDTKKTILLKEWITSIEEINHLKAENEKLRLEKSAEDDVANLIFQHDNASEQEDIKVEIKGEDIEIHD